MITPLTLLAVLPGLACGPATVDYVCGFSADQQVFGEVASERPIDCGAFAVNALEARKRLAAAGISEDWTGVNVIVSARPDLGGSSTGHVIGQTLPEPEGAEINLAGSQEGAGALLHEMIHAWQLGRGNLETESHPGWQVKGWGCATWDTCPDTLDWDFHQFALDVTHGGPADRQDQG